MDELARYLPDLLKLSIATSVGTLLWLVRSSHLLRHRLLNSSLNVSAKHTLTLDALLKQATHNFIVLQGYFFDLMLLGAGRMLGFLMLVTIWFFLFSWTTSWVKEDVIFVAVSACNVFLVLATLVVVHRREKIKDI